jgi:WD40 repeat protein
MPDVAVPACPVCGKPAVTDAGATKSLLTAAPDPPPAPATESVLAAPTGSGARSGNEAPPDPGLDPGTLPFAGPGLSAASSPHGPASVPGFELLRELGRGGMGVVYLARQDGLGRLVALKMILAGEHAGKHERRRFRSEAEAAARLQHPNVVPVFEVGEHAGHPYMALEYCPGGGLDRKLAGTPLPPREAAVLAQTLARAVQAAHDKGVVHRDLKPANVLLADGGVPKVTDFGLAKRLDSGGLTATGNVMGTPSYMAPEQALGEAARIGPATDVYALGAILYELLTGRPPFRAATTWDTLGQVINDIPVSVRQLQPKTPVDLETICLKCLRKDSTGRYRTAAELADDLGRFLGGEAIRARPAGLAERSFKWARRRPAAAGLLLALVAGFIGVLWAYSRAVVEKRRADERAAYARAMEAQLRALVDRSDERSAAPDKAAMAHFVLEFRNLKGHARDVSSVCFSPDGSRLASACFDKTVKLWDAASCSEIRTFKGHADGVSCVCFSPDGKCLASASFDKTVKIWDVASGSEIRTLKGHAGDVNSVCFNPDGTCLASGARDKTVKLWDAASGSEIRTLKGHAHSVSSVCFSPDGSRLASASFDKTVKLWEAASGSEICTLKGHADGVSSICFSPDGSRLASASFDKTVKLWDAASCSEIRTLKGHAGDVNGVCFNPDGTCLASGAFDCTVKVWDVAAGTEIRTLQGHAGLVLSVCCSIDGRRLASSADDGTVLIWDTTPGRQTPVR